MESTLLINILGFICPATDDIFGSIMNIAASSANVAMVKFGTGVEKRHRRDGLVSVPIIKVSRLYRYYPY